MIRGITFSEQTFYSADFAHFQDFFLNGQNGITLGCQVTNDGTAVTIDTGYFIIQGRLLNVEEAEVLDSSKFTEGYNRIVYEVDLSKENTITEFLQGAIKVLNTEELVQENLFTGGYVYQFPFCSFQWDGSAISDFITEAPTMVLDNIFAEVAANYGSFEKMFETWFAGQKEEMVGWVDQQKTDFDTYAQQKEKELQESVDAAKKIIADLEADGFQKAATYSEVIMEASGWDSSTSRYSFESTYPFDSYNIEIQPSDSCTLEQLDAWCEARIVGSVTINACKAYGTIPTVDIPIIITVTKKTSDSEPSTPDDSTEFVVLTSDYSGTAEVTAEIDGEEYDVDNMTTQVDSVEDGSIIITKLED